MRDVETVAAPALSRPALALPAGAVDAHSHVFGPFDRFPPHQASVYALPDAPPDIHKAFRETLGVAYGVLTQPAPYGDDPSAMLAAIEGSNGALCGVAVASPEVTDATLADWAARGIVGLRFVEMRAPGGGRYPGSIGFDALRVLAPRMREHGLHAQLWASADQYAEALPELLTLGLPLVLDHMASPDRVRGAGDPAFRTIVDHMLGGDIWVKLTLCRFFGASADYGDVRPFHDALVEAAPERLIWGSDWPYVRLDPAPDAGRMVDLFANWTADPTVREAILVDNPARLYGLPPREGEAG
ncbi:amidohydrolase family protein [Sphingomonas sp. G-3-2-10]|uniref:amidohydrolase family protein n=1 Tax=Sphingomonas sp. G-3-2-10 TaxID=2728838 RepID=UPI00146C7644|nr:amidohydrolase family protein [Sphingomonas sp. G-3-2-10]NML08184.1 amidohydrolase family protein [Sphingomonas sp. G-3-2-10]